MSQHIFKIQFDLLRNGEFIPAVDLAQPVNPKRGRLKPHVVRSSIMSCWLNKAGRGPTTLILPHRMLHNCGNSSRLDLRRKEPIGVCTLRGSLSKCVATAGVPTRIVRNFGILKIRLFRPTRSDQWMKGPGEVTLANSAAIAIGRRKIPSATADDVKSHILFIRY